MGLKMTKRSLSISRKHLKPPVWFCRALLLVVALLALTTLLLLGFDQNNQPKLLDVASSLFGTKTDVQYSGSPVDTNEILPDVPALIEAIRKATERAGGDADFQEADRERWHKRNPCKSRTELEPFYTRRRFVKHVSPNPKWEIVLSEYEKLHRTCIRKVGFNVDEYFLVRNHSTGCKFVVAGGPIWAGLGNKVLPTIAVLVYAVLTQRVLLVPNASLLPKLICEPFEGSSWGIDTKERYTPVETHENLWTPYKEFEEMVDMVSSGKIDVGSNGTKIYGVRAANWCQPVARFFCDVEQAFYNQIPWIYFTSCVNFLPKLFAIPAFRPVLEDLFPDNMATIHLVRSIMKPSDSVWERVVNVDKMYLKSADRRLGVQIRYRESKPQFERYHDMVNRNVLGCALRSGILPSVNGSTNLFSLPPRITLNGDSDVDSSHPLPTKITSVFITSLFSSLRDHLSNLYHRNPPKSGDVVGIYQLSQGAIQGFGLEEDTQALSEILCLSFSDDLFVTPLSTFGGLAQAYGALTPYFIEYRDDSTLPPCERGQTMDPCYQDPQKTYTCPHDPDLDGRVISDVIPYIVDCPVIDVPNGLQMMTRDLTDRIPS